LVEEIVRVLGYERVPSTIPAWKPTHLTFDRRRAAQKSVQAVLYGSGLFEVMTYSFVSLDQLEGLSLLPQAHLKLKNPLSSEQAYLRSTLLPSHLTVLERNRMYGRSVGIYEISNVFLKRGPGEQPAEPWRLAVSVCDPRGAFARAKGVLDAIAGALGVDMVVSPAQADGYIPGRYGDVSIDGRPAGGIGQLHPDVLRAHKLGGEVAYFEIDLDVFMDAVSTKHYLAPSPFPTMVRDIAILVPIDATWQAVRAATADWDVSFVSDYAGAKLPAGMRSLTIRITLALPDRTPTEAEAAELEAKVLVRLQRKLGAKARG
jgi:phenylalanyl-tRNA synthetase beta chain